MHAQYWETENDAGTQKWLGYYDVYQRSSFEKIHSIAYVQWACQLNDLTITANIGIWQHIALR